MSGEASFLAWAAVAALYLIAFNLFKIAYELACIADFQYTKEAASK